MYVEYTILQTRKGAKTKKKQEQVIHDPVPVFYR